MEQAEAIDQLRAVLEEIVRDEPWPVEREDVQAALRDAREEMGTG